MQLSGRPKGGPDDKGKRAGGAMSDMEHERKRLIGRRPIGRAGGAALSAAAVVAVAVAAMVLAGEVQGTNQVAPATGSSAGAVPWTNRSAPAYTPPAVPMAAGPRVRYAACAAAGLRGRVSSAFGMGAGQYTRYLVLTNVSGHACTLSGAPSVITGLRPGGRQAALAGSASVSADPNLIGPANLQPGQSAQLALTAASMCPGGAASCARRSYAQVTLGVGGGQVWVSFPRSQPLSVITGGSISVSTFGVPAPPQGLISSPLDALTVAIAAPGAVTAGTTADYRVTLRNSTSHAIALSPCPSYAEFVAPAGTSLSQDIHRYFLNCGAVSAIPARGSVTFAMRVAVPSAPGRAKYGWIMQGTSVQGGGAVTVRMGG
jgi:hypothetical protein